MTTATHTTVAMLTVAVAQLARLNREAKKNGGEALFSLGTDMGNGVTWRELSAWAKAQKAKAAEVSAEPVKPTAGKKAPAGAKREPSKLSTISDAINPKSAANKSEAVALKASEVRDQIVLIGRTKETVVRIGTEKSSGMRVATTDKGTIIPFASIERNNRGNLRVKPADEQMVSKAAPKATPKVAAAPVKEGVRNLEIGTSTNISAASYDKARKVLTVAFHSGSVYEYKGVTLKDIKEFEAAKSKGAHISKVIKPAKDVVCVAKAPRKQKAA